KAHLRSRHERRRLGQELVEVVIGPGAALGLHASREIEAAAAFTLLVADDAVEIRTDMVGAVLLEGVAGQADLRGSLALLDRSGLQQLLDRLRRRRRGCLGVALGGFLGRNRK